MVNFKQLYQKQFPNIHSLFTLPYNCNNTNEETIITALWIEFVSESVNKCIRSTGSR